MPRLIIAQLRRRSGRAVAMLLGVLVATTGFTVLTGSTATSRLRVTETVDANARAAYDILVRPAGARSSLEEDRGLVRPNFLSGQPPSASPAGNGRCRPNSRAANSNGSRSRGRSSGGRSCCSPTSRPATWTRLPAPKSWTCSTGFASSTG